LTPIESSRRDKHNQRHQKYLRQTQVQFEFSNLLLDFFGLPQLNPFASRHAFKTRHLCPLADPTSLLSGMVLLSPTRLVCHAPPAQRIIQSTLA
jgi:hypothetical protein